MSIAIAHESRDARAAALLAKAGATIDGIDGELAKASARGTPSAAEMARWRGRLSAASRTVGAFARYVSGPSDARLSDLERAAQTL